MKGKVVEPVGTDTLAGPWLPAPWGMVYGRQRYRQPNLRRGQFVLMR